MIEQLGGMLGGAVLDEFQKNKGRQMGAIRNMLSLGGGTGSWDQAGGSATGIGAQFGGMLGKGNGLSLPALGGGAAAAPQAQPAQSFQAPPDLATLLEAERRRKMMGDHGAPMGNNGMT